MGTLFLGGGALSQCSLFTGSQHHNMLAIAQENVADCCKPNEYRPGHTRKASWTSRHILDLMSVWLACGNEFPSRVWGMCWKVRVLVAAILLSSTKDWALGPVHLGLLYQGATLPGPFSLSSLGTEVPAKGLGWCVLNKPLKHKYQLGMRSAFLLFVFLLKSYILRTISFNPRVH